MYRIFNSFGFRRASLNVRSIIVFALSGVMVLSLTSIGYSPTSVHLSTQLETVRARPHYTFDIDLDYPGHRLDAIEQLTIPNPAGKTISEVVFNVPAAHIAGTFDLHQIQVGDQPAQFDLAGTTLAVALPDSLEPAGVVTLTLDFSVHVPALIDPQSFASANLGYTDEAMTIGYWYPLLAPYRPDHGWLTVPWYPIGDPFASESADYTATITATPGVTVVAGGEAAHRGNVWHFDLPRARTFGMIASPRYWQTNMTFGAVTYSVYALGEHAYLTPITLQTMVRAVQLYSSLYGPYPYSTFRMAEVSGPWSMEFSGLGALGATEFADYDGTNRNRLIRIAAHEVSHQWWYNVVGNDQAHEPWLDEGLARFNELRYYEAYAPHDARWWWDTVITPWQPNEPLDSSVYDFQSHRAYLTDIYNQGAMFLNTLRARIRPTAFDALLHDLYQRGSFRVITTSDFFDVLNEHLHTNIRAIVRRFFKQ